MIDQGGLEMRDFDSLDTSSFRAFWAASETLNFTLAAKNVGLTQSGISQHILRLEKQLGVPLFERVNKKVFLTDAGNMLRSYVDQYLDQVELLKEKISSQNVALSGLVSYAMPASCLMTPHLPLLLKKRKAEFENVKLNVSLCSNDEVVEKLLNNEIQFGFITKKINIAGVKLIPFCFEHYVLISSDKSLFKDINAQTIKELPFIEHTGVSVLFDHWRQVHLPKAKNLSWESLNIMGRVNSITGAIRMVENGVGMTIMPEHCVSAVKESPLYHYGNVEDVNNQIYFITLENEHTPRRVKRVSEELFNIIRSKS